MTEAQRGPTVWQGLTIVAGIAILVSLLTGLAHPSGAPLYDDQGVCSRSTPQNC